VKGKTMTVQFKKATRSQAKMRLALVGPAGSGKSYTALTFARVFGRRIAVIDSENESASLYADDVAEFDVTNLESFSPRKYVEAIHAAEAAGYDVIVVDGISQAWAGKDGALEMVDKAAKRSQSGNTFMAWRDVTPEHNTLVDAMVRCKAHLIVTMRAKTEYVMQEGPGGKKTPKKIGMAPIQRDGLDFEFTVVGEMDVDHNLMVSKTRCKDIDGAVISKPGPELAETLLRWLNSGAPMQERPARPTEAAPSASGASMSRTTSAPGGSTPEPRRDEYGIAMPTLGQCPRFRSGDDQGKLWSEVSGAKIEAIAKEHGSKFNELQTEWAQYLIARRAARKAKEAREAEAAQAAAAPTGDPEPPADVKLPGDSEAAQ
jgi:pyruvate/2-oxoglutarate dehydrogenase complex dihydrolipoamide acyltransferase (E2) component